MITFLMKIKNFILNIGRLTAKQLMLLLLVVLQKILSVGSFFIAFYFIFFYDTKKSFISNFPGLIMLGFAVGVFFAIVDILKTGMIKHTDPSKIEAFIYRALYDIRYLVLIVGLFYYYTITFTHYQVYLYGAIIIVCRIIAKFLEGRFLALQEIKDWSKKD